MRSPIRPENALWEIFSTNVERVRQGLRHYHRRSTASQDLLYRLILNRLGLPAMTYTVEDLSAKAVRNSSLI